MGLKKTFVGTGTATVQTPFGQLEAGQSVYEKEVLCLVTNAIVEREKTSFFVHFTGENVDSVSEYAFTTDLNGPNAIKQAYLYLKTLPEFEGAEDV